MLDLNDIYLEITQRTWASYSITVPMFPVLQPEPGHMRHCKCIIYK